MRRTYLVLATSMVLVSGCGSGRSLGDRPRPPIPIDLTVYINDSHVSLSPDNVGAGEVTLVVTNQASSSQSLQVSGSGGSLANTGPINPMATAQFSVDLTQPGQYTVSTGGSGGTTDAQLSSPAPIRPATLQVGQPRPAANNQLLTP
jgi:hypothetical protein